MITDEEIAELWLELQNAPNYQEVVEFLKEAFDDESLKLGGTGDRDE